MPCDARGMDMARPRSAVAVAVALALVCAGLVVALVVSSWSTPDSQAVDDLPTVAEVIVATAHQHGIELPELTAEQREALTAEPVAATDASAYEQLSSQLRGVAEIDGIGQAVFLLGEVAAVSSEAERLCPRLFDELVSLPAASTASSSAVPASPC